METEQRNGKGEMERKRTDTLLLSCPDAVKIMVEVTQSV